MPTPQIINKVVRREGQIDYVFTFPRGKGTIEGIDQLVQQVIMHLLTTPGSDRYERDAGGGLRAAFIGFQQSNDPARAAAEISEAVVRTKQQLLLSQIGQEGLTQYERLLDLRIERLELVGTRFDLRIRIVNEANQDFALEI